MLCIAFAFFVSMPLSAQAQLTEAEQVAICKKATYVVRNFFEVVTRLGANDVKKSTKEKMIKTTVEKCFVESGTVDERNAAGKHSITRPVEKYLRTIANRGESTPVLVSFEIIDNLTPNKLKKKVAADGSVFYEGKARVRQYYCKLKAVHELSEDISENCAYSDTTIKEVKFSIRKGKTDANVSWEILIEQITVKSVTRN